MQLVEIDRCRKILEKQLELFGQDSACWVQYAEFEAVLDESQRTRAIYELAVTQDELDMPERVWKAYIEMEIQQGQHQKAVSLYERLIQKSQGHFKVYSSYGTYMATQYAPVGSSKSLR